MTSTKTVRAGIYARQSLNKTGEQEAVERFIKDGYAICAARGWTPVEVFVDDDTSASNGKPRKDYQRMLQWVRDGKLQAIATAEHDRLHRDVLEQAGFVNLARERNLLFACNSGDIDLSSDDGEFMAILFAALAQKEVRRKGARQRSANKQMATDKGRPWWPSRPFGYDADRDATTGKWWTVRRDSDKKIIAVNTIRKHPTEAALLKKAYRRFNAGTTLRTLAKDWNAAGIKTPRGNNWTGSQVRELLLAARNAGLREYGGRVVGNGTWPEIVTRAVWEQAASKLKGSKGTHAPRARKYLLSGLARCGLCGSPLSSAISSRGQRQYACKRLGCQKISRDGVKLDDLITRAVVRRLSRDDAVELLRPPVDPVDADALREERRALNDRLVQLGKDFATAPPEITKAALDDINGRLAEIKAALDDPGKAAIFEGVIGAKDVAKAFDKLDLGRKRTIVDALMTITVNPVGRGTGPVFDPDAIDAPYRDE